MSFEHRGSRLFGRLLFRRRVSPTTSAPDWRDTTFGPDMKGPGFFNTREALGRLLNGDSLQEIFQLVPRNQLTGADFSTRYTGGTEFPWQTKAIVNTLRRAATETMATELAYQYLPVKPLPTDQTLVTPEVVTHLRERAEASFDLLKPVAVRLGLNEGAAPPQGSVFEKALEKLAPYMGTAEGSRDEARRTTLAHILDSGHITRHMAPEFLSLLMNVYHDGRGRFKKELTTEYPTFAFFRDLVRDSDQIMLRGTSHTGYESGLFLEVAMGLYMKDRRPAQTPPHPNGTGFITEKFELVRSRKRGGSYSVIMKSKPAQEVLNLQKKWRKSGADTFLETGCPASSDLIVAVLKRSVSP